jgi:serine/threonine protein kinase/rhodanese-related sulfurtransferase
VAFLDESFWLRLSPLLDQALELEGEPRDAFVRSLRERDPGLAEALERHLAEHDRALSSGFLELPAGAAPISLEGRTFGAYELVERLGAGGMGTVWRARRNDGRFEGDVAVKLLHPSLLDERGSERFRSEGSILSRLTHAGIARLYDAGVSPAGQPYLVLELVDGLRIDRFADAHRLPVRARLELFLQVADAVAFAHSNLVVHRDLKPSNILVDGAGRAKLLDFGIATLVDQASGEAVGRTLTAAQALTPEYAAPEQLEDGAITTATDVYSLGVLLYELLTGRHPVARADTSPAELVRAITAGATPRMSERVRQSAAEAGAASGDGGPSLFEVRGATPERLARALAGDLDTIVGRALKRAAAERYPTVVELADGTVIAADLVVLSVGVRPRSELAASAGLAMTEAGAILVDDQQRTSDPHIWAVGDATASVHAVTGTVAPVALATPANRGGRVAADSIAGRGRRSPRPLGTAIVRVFDLTVAMTGASRRSLAGRAFHTARVHAGHHAGYFPGAETMHLLLHFDSDGRILGAQGAGRAGIDKRIDVIATAARGGLRADDLVDLDLTYAPPFGSAKDPVMMLGMIADNVLSGRLHQHDPAEPLDPATTLVLDVRNPDEWAAGHVDGALLVPQPEVAAAIDTITQAAAGRPIAVHCASGFRSYLAHRTLAGAGIVSANVSGGFMTLSVLQPQLLAHPQTSPASETTNGITVSSTNAGKNARPSGSTIATPTLAAASSSA